MRPDVPPIGLSLARAARSVSRAFDDCLVQAGGSLPVWLVLLSLKTQPRANQRQLADAIGIREATLTHHLNAMTGNGLVTRRRDLANRRIHVVELTDLGERMFARLAQAAAAFDRQLRHGLSDQDSALLQALLARLTENASAQTPPVRPSSSQQARSAV